MSSFNKIDIKQKVQGFVSIDEMEVAELIGCDAESESNLEEDLDLDDLDEELLNMT